MMWTPPHAVSADLEFEVAPERVWEALTCARLTTAWWGQLPQDIVGSGQALTLITGADTFDQIWVEFCEPPRHLVYVHSELGAGAASSVHWDLVEQAGTCRVTVTEYLPSDSPAALGLCRDLWLHRLRVLDAVLRQDDPAAVDLCAIHHRRLLSSATWRPLHASNLVDWLPVSGPVNRPSGFYIYDEAGARLFQISYWQALWDEKLRLRIEVPHRVSTRAEIGITADASGTWIEVRHDGWCGYLNHRETGRSLRCRFDATWRAALDAAAAERGRNAGIA